MPRQRRRAVARSFVVFGLVGALGTACQFAVLAALVHGAGLDVVLASTIGAVVGAFVNFFLNHRITFDAAAPMSETGPRFVVLVLVSFVNNALLVYLMSRTLHWNYLVAQLVATGGVFVGNYLLSSLWVFAEKRSGAAR